MIQVPKSLTAVQFDVERVEKEDATCEIDPEEIQTQHEDQTHRASDSEELH